VRALNLLVSPASASSGFLALGRLATGAVDRDHALAKLLMVEEGGQDVVSVPPVGRRYISIVVSANCMTRAVAEAGITRYA
jgi:hypothetical protein